MGNANQYLYAGKVGESYVVSKAQAHTGGFGRGIPSNLLASDLFRAGSQMLLLLLLGANQSYFDRQVVLFLY